MPGNHFNHKVCEEIEGENEISVELPLNGELGVDPRPKKLMRSSSTPDFINPARNNGNAMVPGCNE